MAVSISSLQTNMLAMNSGRMLGISTKSLAKSTEKLSSGYRINRAADDAAGLAISEKLRYQIRGLNQGAENLQDGISLCQVADGALSEVDDILHRMNELAVKSANGTNTDEDREYIQEEISQLQSEITRIGRTTTFNDIKIFDNQDNTTESVSKLVTSPAAETGMLSESYLGNNGKYYPAASMNFSNIDATNVNLLDGASFSFNCSDSCAEKFTVVFSTDGSGSSIENAALNDRWGNHTYVVDISECIDGEDVVDTLYSYISANLPSSANSSLASSVGGVGVSHSNVLVKDGSSLVVVGTGTGSYDTAEAAENAFLKEEPKRSDYGSTSAFYAAMTRYVYGRVDCSELMIDGVANTKYEFGIQCSSNYDDREYVYTKRMNAQLIGVDPLSVDTQATAEKAIGKVKKALSRISSQRSNIGATQNRLEHSYNNNLNISENETSAESKIRDTDMSSEMVKYSLQNILISAGQSMLAQANQTPSGVLNLLQ